MLIENKKSIIELIYNLFFLFRRLKHEMKYNVHIFFMKGMEKLSN